MRCQENSGFLMLHRCESIAEYQCAQCGRKVCGEHAVAADAPVPTDVTAAGAPPPMPAPGSGMVCTTCARKRQGQIPRQGGVQDNDPYYRFPSYGGYYGGYHPYHTGYYYDDSDRRAFDRDQASAKDATETAAGDGLGS